MGIKVSKSRLTVLFICNKDSSDKYVYVIGNSATPRCLRHIKNPPIPYFSNKKAWMTGEVWTNILLQPEIKMKAQKRNIILFCDNARCHVVPAQLQHIKVVFLPPNVTSLIQPLDYKE